jgi:hypothetical protein
MWVADDGSFGSGEVIEFDTSRWTEEDFGAIEDASDSERLSVAQKINHARNSA